MDDNIGLMLQRQQRLYLGQAVLLAMAGGIIYSICTWQLPGPPDHANALTFQLIILVLAPSSLAIGYVGFRTWVKKISQNEPLFSRLNKYYQLVLIRSAILELPAYFSCATALIAGEALLLLALPPLLLVFVLLRPTVHSLAEDLQLTAAEKAKLESEW